MTFRALLAYLFLLILLMPFLLETSWGSPILELSFTGLLLLCLASVRYQGHLWLAALTLAIPGLLLGWVELLYPQYPPLVVGSLLLKVSFYTLLSLSFLLEIFRQKTVTLDTVFGAMCGYLILGVVWALIYTFIDYTNEEAFRGPFQPGALQASGELLRHHFEAFLYFSLVTLSTLGYGDLAPVSAFARNCAVVEAVMGQFYLAVFLGRMIGLSLAGPGRISSS